jgi:hypothetical protein
MTPSPTKNAKMKKKKKKMREKSVNFFYFFGFVYTSIYNYFVCKFIELIFLFAFHSGSCYLLCCHMEREGRDERRVGRWNETSRDTTNGLSIEMLASKSAYLSSKGLF